MHHGGLHDNADGGGGFRVDLHGHTIDLTVSDRQRRSGFGQFGVGCCD